MQRRLWAYWHQGEEQAPFLIRQCLGSWRRLNPDWPLTVLDRDSLPDGVSCELVPFRGRGDIGLQAFTDLLRLALLHRYGGAWVDATLFCTQPLDAWLPAMVEDDFFAFASSRSDRMVTTWFLYGTPESRLLEAWLREMQNYWATHSFRAQGYFGRQVMRKLMSLRKRGILDNDIWFSPFVTRLLRLYPYPVNMYLFERALRRHPELWAAWASGSHLYDFPAERIQNEFGMNATATPDSIAFIRAAETPVHKLNWRQDQGEAVAGSNLERLLQIRLAN